MIVNNVYLEATAVKREQFPEGGLPEVAFAGRSNVGKSTLINTLINRKALARTSQTPGKTRTINFYNVEEKLLFADLPGYGYAKISKSESAKWGKMVEGYLLNRAPLRAIIMLLDIRRDVTENDKQMLQFLEYYGHSVIFVATKTDKESRLGVKSRLKKIALDLERPLELIFPFSGLSKQGREAIWIKIEETIC